MWRRVLTRADDRRNVPGDREEVVFWHFWGGRDRAVVEEIVGRFNRSQDAYHVRAIAMPGNNLDLKLFLSVAGGDPPDVVNQDDPIVADWAHRGALVPLDELASAEEIANLDEWLFPSARRLGSYQGRMYALCNGLDIRALYYNETLLAEHGLKPPRTIDELDTIAKSLSPPDQTDRRERFGYLPDPRRLWAWGIVFGGEFYDEDAGEITADSEPVIRALEWMASYSDRYGPHMVQSFRTGDQALSGASFPLLNSRRYAVIMDGQWRVRDVRAYVKAERDQGRTPDRIGVTPLPAPNGGRTNAGWVNGNFFVVPRGSRCPRGAWEFMKFWSGFSGNEPEAARGLCCWWMDSRFAGGWLSSRRFKISWTSNRCFGSSSSWPLANTKFRFPRFRWRLIINKKSSERRRKRSIWGAEPREALSEAAERVRGRLAEVKVSAGGTAAREIEE